MSYLRQVVQRPSRQRSHSIRRSQPHTEHFIAHDLLSSGLSTPCWLQASSRVVPGAPASMKNTTCGDARAMATPARAIATRRWVIVLGILTTTLLTGCVTATGRGEAALESGRYGEAATRFEEALAGKPGSLDALVGLGIAKYRLRAPDQGQPAPAPAPGPAPRLPPPPPYPRPLPPPHRPGAAARGGLRPHVA